MTGTIGCTPGRMAKPALVIASRNQRVFASSRSRRSPLASRRARQAREAATMAGARGRGEGEGGGGQRVGEEVGRRPLAEQGHDLAAAGGEAAAGAAERLAEGGGDHVHAVGHPAVGGRATAAGTEEAGGVAVVHEDERVVA